MSKRKPALPRAKTGAKQDKKQGINSEYTVGYKKPPVDKQFKKGQSGNPHGRPKNFQELRELIQEIGAEPLTDDGMTRIAAKIRLLFASKQSGDNQTLLLYGYGKPPDESIVHDWHDEIIQALKEKLIAPFELVRTLGLDDARPLLLAAGISERIDAASATAIIDSSAAETTSTDTDKAI